MDGPRDTEPVDDELTDRVSCDDLDDVVVPDELFEPLDESVFVLELELVRLAETEDVAVFVDVVVLEAVLELVVVRVDVTESVTNDVADVDFDRAPVRVLV